MAFAQLEVPAPWIFENKLSPSASAADQFAVKFRCPGPASSLALRTGIEPSGGAEWAGEVVTPAHLRQRGASRRHWWAMHAKQSRRPPAPQVTIGATRPARQLRTWLRSGGSTPDFIKETSQASQQQIAPTYAHWHVARAKLLFDGNTMVIGRQDCFSTRDARLTRERCAPQTQLECRPRSDDESRRSQRQSLAGTR